MKTHKYIFFSILFVFHLYSCDYSYNHATDNVLTSNFNVDTFYLKDSYFIVGVDDMGNKVGKAYYFDFEGNKIGIGSFFGNKANGLFYRISKNGNILSIIHNVDNELHGIFEQYSNKGKLHVSGFYFNNKKHGEWICYDTLTSLITSRKHYLNDVNVGTNYFYDNNTGRLDSIIMKDFNGFKEKVVVYTDGDIKVTGTPYLVYFKKDLAINEESDITIIVPSLPSLITYCECLNVPSKKWEMLFPTSDIGSLKYEYKLSFDKIGIHTAKCIIKLVFESGETFYEDTLSMDFYVN